MTSFRRTAAAFLFFLVAASAVFGAGGAMSGEKHLRSIKTEWFDIIYSQDSAQSASILVENADRIYREVSAYLGTKPHFRMPVVITPAQDKFSALYSAYPYNHIIIYDTVPDDDLALFSEMFISSFRHEIVHAVTYNMKNKFWNTISNIFGDAYNPAVVTMTPAFKEGAAVAYESGFGEGMLNDAFSLHILVQAKLEGHFPDVGDIQGAKDRYTDKYESYYYGGAFTEWLQKKYGMEKYSEFWYRAANLKTLAYFWNFKDVYSISIDDAWKEFSQTICVPDIPADPVAAGEVSSLFTDSSNNQLFPYLYSNRGTRYTSFTTGGFGAAFVDQYSGAVWYTEWNADKKSYKIPRILFREDGITRIQLSGDGRYLAVSQTTESKVALANEVRLYNIKSRRWFRIKETGIRDAALIMKNDGYFLAAVQTESQNTAIKLYVLEETPNQKTFQGYVTFGTIKFDYGEIPSSLADAGKGCLAYIFKRGMKWSLRTYDWWSAGTNEYQLPDTIRVRNLSGSSEGLYFSWVSDGILPRLGILSETENGGKILLQQNDISGGIYCPSETALSPDFTAYIGMFCRDTRILIVDKKTIKFSETTVTPRITYSDSALFNRGGSKSKNIKYPNLVHSKIYTPVKYYKRGMMIPFGFASTYTSGEDGLASVSAPFGLSYFSSNPWNTDQVLLTASYSMLTNSAVSMIRFNGGTATDLFAYKFQGQTEYDRHGFKQKLEELTLSSAVPLGNVSYLKISDSLDFLAGRQTKTTYPSDYNFIDKINPVKIFGVMETDDLTARIYGANIAKLEFTNIHQSGPGAYEYIGFSSSLAYDALYYSMWGEEFSGQNMYQNISAEIVGRLPKLVPVKCAYGFTYNLPFTTAADIFPSQYTFFDTNTSVILFSQEIQKSLPFLPVFYMNRWTLSASYEGYFKYGKAESWAFAYTPQLFHALFENEMHYYDIASATLSLTLTPNVGGAASSTYAFDVFAQFMYRIRPENDDRFFGLKVCGVLMF